MTTQLHCGSSKASQTIYKQDCASPKYLQTQELEFPIIFNVMKEYSSGFFTQSFNNVNIQLTSHSNHTAGLICPRTQFANSCCRCRFKISFNQFSSNPNRTFFPQRVNHGPPFIGNTAISQNLFLGPTLVYRDKINTYVNPSFSPSLAERPLNCPVLGGLLQTPK